MQGARDHPEFLLTAGGREARATLPLNADEGEVDALGSSRLVRFADVVIFHRPDLERAGVEIVPTFRTSHVTLCHIELSELVRRLLSCETHRAGKPVPCARAKGQT